jgi:hypothetical protein
MLHSVEKENVVRGSGISFIKPCAKHHSPEVCQDITVVQALTAVSLEKTTDTWLQLGRNVILDRRR